MTQQSLFSLEGVTLTRPDQDGQQRTILDQVSLAIRDRSITFIIGPSGSGKSTLLRLLNRLVSPTAGRVFYRGQELSTLPPGVLRQQVGLVLQSPVMLPGSVRQNLEAGLRLQGKSLADPVGWLERLRLPANLLERPAAELSGGEKQRLSLARTLVTEPAVLLLDEVTASLDVETSRLVEELIAGSGLPVVWVSHQPEQVRRLGHWMVRVEAGRVEEVSLG